MKKVDIEVYYDNDYNHPATYINKKGFLKDDDEDCISFSDKKAFSVPKKEYEEYLNALEKVKDIHKVISRFEGICRSLFIMKTYPKRLAEAEAYKKKTQRAHCGSVTYLKRKVEEAQERLLKEKFEY